MYTGTILSEVACSMAARAPGGRLTPNSDRALPEAWGALGAEMWPGSAGGVQQSVAPADGSVDPGKGHVHHDPYEDDHDHHGHHQSEVALVLCTDGPSTQAERVDQNEELAGHQRVPGEGPSLLQ